MYCYENIHPEILCRHSPAGFHVLFKHMLLRWPLARAYILKGFRRTLKNPTLPLPEPTDLFTMHLFRSLYLLSDSLLVVQAMPIAVDSIGIRSTSDLPSRAEQDLVYGVSPVRCVSLATP
jgi:hypothetical protein